MLGSKFIVTIVNVAISYFHSQKKPTPKQIRWQDFLTKLDYIMEYKPRKTNFVADALSHKEHFAAILHCKFSLMAEYEKSYIKIKLRRSWWNMQSR